MSDDRFMAVNPYLTAAICISGIAVVVIKGVIADDGVLIVTGVALAVLSVLVLRRYRGHRP